MIDRIRRSARPTGEGRTRIDPRAAKTLDQPAAPPIEAAPDTSESKRRRVNPHDAKTRPATPASDEQSRRRRQVPSAAPTAPASEKPTHSVVRMEDPAGYVLVVSFADEVWSDAERELLGAARMLADEHDNTAVLLLRIDQSSAPCDAEANGVDRLMAISGTGQPDATADLLVALFERYKPRHLIFADGGIDGDIARRIAAVLGERPASAVTRLGRGMAIARCDGGRREFSRDMPRILLLAPGAGDILDKAPKREARILPAPSPAARTVKDNDLIDLGPEPMDVGTVPLDQAAFIVSAGDGVSDWSGFHDVADALSAAIGGSRQVCDAGHLPRSRQVGASGTLVTAKCYLAFGISGAPQHLQGVARCRHIIAVNTDLHAAMIKRADLSIIADAQQVIPSLARLARERRHGS